MAETFESPGRTAVNIAVRALWVAIANLLDTEGADALDDDDVKVFTEVAGHSAVQERLDKWRYDNGFQEGRLQQKEEGDA